MHAIGNEHDALTILHWVRDHSVEYGKPYCVEQESAPYGWKFIGTGSFRSVWLSPEGVAYKVTHTDWDDQSVDEVNNLKRAWEREVPDRCRLPRFADFCLGDEIVVAVEFIKGRVLNEYRGEGKNGYYSLMHEIEKYYKLYDMHDENVMVDEDGYLVPVDFGG